MSNGGRDRRIPPGEIEEIFVGSTIKDLRTYRAAVQKELLAECEIRVQLSEGWSLGHISTVDECERRVRASDGYLGIFAYNYGSVPPHYEKSITQLEYEWACDHWESSAPERVAVFMPEGPAPFGEDGELLDEEKWRRRSSDAAKEIWDATPLPTDPVKRKQQLKRQSAFVRLVQGLDDEWRFVKFFANADRLALQVTARCLKWQKKILEARNRPMVRRRVPRDEEFGQLGRKKQVAAVEEVLGILGSDPTAPGAALVLYGNEDAGQKQLLAALERSAELTNGQPVLRGRPPSPKYQIDDLVRWFSEGLVDDERLGREVRTIDDLAEGLHLALRDQQVVVLLDEVWRLEGGLAAAHAAFWGPLYQELQQRCTIEPVNNALIVVLGVYIPRPDVGNQFSVDWDPYAEPHDFARLIRLPALGDISKSQLMTWLSMMHVPDVRPNGSGGRRQEVITTVLHDREGNPDATPRRVFDRLLAEDLWPQGV